MIRNVLIYYSKPRGSYAGWQKQISRLFATIDHESKEYYHGEATLFFKDIIKFKLLSQRLIIILPNLYGYNKLYWVILSLFNIEVFPRVSGGELLTLSKYKNIVKAFFKNSKMWVLNGQDLKTALSLGFNPVLIPNAVYYREPVLARVLDLENKKFTILMCGTLSKRKGQLEVLNWLEKMKFKGVVQLLGPIRDIEKEGSNLMFDLIKSLSLINFEVRFIDEQEEVSDFYKNSDLLIMNSSLEGMPNTVLEALYFGLPVIGSNIPGTADILFSIDEKLCYKKNDFLSFSKTFENILNPVEYQLVSLKGIELTRTSYSPVRVANDLLKILE